MNVFEINIGESREHHRHPVRCGLLLCLYLPLTLKPSGLSLRYLETLTNKPGRNLDPWCVIFPPEQSSLKLEL